VRQRHGDRRTSSARGASADGIHDDEHGALFLLQGRINVLRRAQFAKTDVRQFLAHSYKQFFRVHRNSLADFGR